MKLFKFCFRCLCIVGDSLLLVQAVFSCPLDYGAVVLLAPLGLLPDSFNLFYIHDKILTSFYQDITFAYGLWT